MPVQRDCFVVCTPVERPYLRMFFAGAGVRGGAGPHFCQTMSNIIVLLGCLKMLLRSRKGSMPSGIESHKQGKPFLGNRGYTWVLWSFSESCATFLVVSSYKIYESFFKKLNLRGSACRQLTIVPSSQTQTSYGISDQGHFAAAVHDLSTISAWPLMPLKVTSGQVFPEL
jgi:hypothetical protein